jgi:hypothetical protein
MTMPGLTPPVSARWTSTADRAAGFPGRWLRWLRWLRWPTVFAIAGAALFFAYLQLAERIQFGSDGAVVEQQAWEALHGNLLLHGWTLPDIALYTIEIPEFAMLEWAHGGLSPEVIHVAEALNLTLVVLLVALLAMGRATGREGMIRALIAAGIIFAPVPGPNGTVLLANPDHLGTQIPLWPVQLLRR